jgi:Fe(3+) dicitrate transport protein
MVFFALFNVAHAQSENKKIELEKVYITGGKEHIVKKPGSATLIDELELEKFEYTDIHRVLNAVPGVNLQEEDGYGLRPNIGLRGTSPERSKKITVMEDGVLSGPAPYSAPAAYYFPSVSRMSAVEVFKGPSTIQYGPATVGGAVNLVSRTMPYVSEGELDLQYGSDNFQRFNVYQGQQLGRFSYLVEGLRVSADGFKNLDTGGDTGFVKNDFLVKTQWQIMGATSHTFQLKLGYADEQSDETYLGLTQADFNQDAYRRYGASQLDQTDWQHKQFQLSHVLDNGELTLSTDVYRNEFHRDWFKLNGFNSTTVSILSVLQDPENPAYSDFYNALTGSSASLTSEQQLRIGNNGREYISQGVQTRGNQTFYFGHIVHNLELGVRVHQDSVDSIHTEQNYQMASGGALTALAGTFKTTLSSKIAANGIAVYIQDEIEIGKNIITLGVRHEDIETTKETYGSLTGVLEGKETLTQAVTLPGIGLFHHLSAETGILAGIYKGFTAATPSGNTNIEPELSTNYELGLRYSGIRQLELVGFINDYQQFSGTCASSQGCDSSNIGVQANAGGALVYGLEAGWRHSLLLNQYHFPVSVTYTFSQGEFSEGFTDINGAFGESGQNIEKGFELAYLPAHRLNAQVGVSIAHWELSGSALYQSEMRTVPGQGVIEQDQKVPSYLVVDLSASYQLMPNLKAYGSVDNIFDKVYMVSSKPYGHRPGKPQSINLGIKYTF